MPTYESTRRFDRDYEALTEDERAAFRVAVTKFVEDLDRGGKLRKGLRVKGIQGTTGIFEMTWAADGRATFQYGPSRRKGETHIVWRRVGTHEVLRNP
jgi:hypothetical protein